jgi:streptogramin lyase
MKRAALLLCLCCSCFGSSTDDPFQPATSELDVTFTPPPGQDAKITLKGPGDFAIDIDKSVKLTGLQAGTYTAEAPSSVVATSIIDTVYSVDLPVAGWKLGAGQTLPLTLEYKMRPGSGAIWLTQFNDQRLLGGWYSQTLLKGGAAAADAQVLTSWQTMLALQLDPQGNLWLLASDAGVASLVEFSWKDLVPGESAPAPRAMQAGERVTAFVFDLDGGAWCITADAKLVHYSAAMLTAGDLSKADVILQGGGHSLDQPVSLAMDAVGNLWVTDASGTLNRLSPRELVASGYALPTASLAVPTPGAMTIDAQGNAWIASGGVLYRYTAGQLGQSGPPTAAGAFDLGAVQIHSFGFDALNEVWITYTDTAADHTSLGMLTPAQMVLSGKPTPLVVLQTPDQRGGPSLLLIDPPPAGTPSYGIPK